MITVVAARAAAADAGGPAPSTEPRRNWFDTPFGAAVTGLPGCPRPEGPLITEAQMRSLAHARIERGTSCWLAKKCEDSNAYRRDPEIQGRVVDAIRAQPGFAGSSVWVTTERHWITLQGCLQSSPLRRALIETVKAVDGVEEVFDQLIVGTRGTPRWTVDPAWSAPENEGKDQAKKKPTR